MLQSASFPEGLQTLITSLISKHLPEVINSVKTVDNLKAVQAMPWELNVIHVNLMDGVFKTYKT